MTTINLGLRRGAAGAAIPKARALRALRKAGVEVLRYRLAQGTEPTLVALVRHAPSWRLMAVARELGQMAIAVCAHGQGALIGPHAGEWGHFVPEFFVPL